MNMADTVFFDANLKSNPRLPTIVFSVSRRGDKTIVEADRRIRSLPRALIEKFRGDALFSREAIAFLEDSVKRGFSRIGRFSVDPSSYDVIVTKTAKSFTSKGGMMLPPAEVYRGSGEDFPEELADLAETAKTNALICVAKQDGRIVSAAYTFEEPTENRYCEIGVQTCEEYRRRHFALATMRVLLGELEKRGATAIYRYEKSNLPSEGLSSACGFELCEEGYDIAVFQEGRN